MLRVPIAALALSAVGCSASAQPGSEPRVLVFSRTAAFRHASIPDGVRAVQELGQGHGFGVESSEAAAVFSDAGLRPFRAVVFLIVSEWMRNLQLDVRLDSDGRLAGLRRLPDLGLHMPIDFDVGPDGALYALEYGPDDYFFPGLGRLVRVEGAP
jgi:hypothetical protein